MFSSRWHLAGPQPQLAQAHSMVRQRPTMAQPNAGAMLPRPVRMAPAPRHPGYQQPSVELEVWQAQQRYREAVQARAAPRGLQGIGPVAPRSQPGTMPCCYTEKGGPCQDGCRYNHPWGFSFCQKGSCRGRATAPSTPGAGTSLMRGARMANQAPGGARPAGRPSRPIAARPGVASGVCDENCAAKCFNDCNNKYLKQSNVIKCAASCITLQEGIDPEEMQVPRPAGRGQHGRVVPGARRARARSARRTRARAASVGRVNGCRPCAAAKAHVQSMAGPPAVVQRHHGAKRDCCASCRRGGPCEGGCGSACTCGREA